MDEPRHRPDGLQLDEHRQFQERFWKLERMAWAGFSIITAGALLGLTGAGGLFATSTAESSSAIVSYPRVARWDAADEFKIVLKPKDRVAARTVMFSSGFADSFQLEDIQPQPSASKVDSEGQIMAFANSDSKGGQITLHIRAQTVGRNSFAIAIDGDQPFPLTTYVLP